MKELLYGKRKYVFPLLHFLLSFFYERSILVFGSGRDIELPIPKNMIISDTAERVMGYVISKLFAAVIIFFLWSLLFWIVENWRKKKNLRFFLLFFGICLIAILLLWPIPFVESEDNYITYSFARRFWPEYWHGAYTGFLYAALLMVVPNPAFISVFQLIFGVFVLGYLYNRIVDSPVLQGKGKYCVFLIFLMPKTYTLFTNSYRTELYALLSMFAVAMTAMDVVDQRKRGTLSLVGNLLLCGFLSVWRTEGIILGFLLFLVQLLYVYRYRFSKSVLLFLGLLLTFGVILIPQKLGDIKYYGKDYAFINSFPTLKNILCDPGANLDYKEVIEDMDALERVTPVELIRYYGMDGYRRYNYANGRADINQSLANEETASAYRKAYYRLILHNLPIYAKTQLTMLLSAIMVIPEPYDATCVEVPVQDLPPWELKSWGIGAKDLANTWGGMETLINWVPRQLFMLYVKNGIAAFEKALSESGFYRSLLILIPLLEIFLFFKEGIRLLKKKKNLFGLAGIAFLLLGQAAAITMVMPMGALVYFHAYYYCSFVLCLIYLNCFRCGKAQESEADGNL